MNTDSADDFGSIKSSWDLASGDPEMTVFKRAARRHQVEWRVRKGYPHGEHPKGQPNGSVLSDEVGLEYKNFLSDHIADSVRNREETPQNRQTFDKVRLRNHLLSSMPMCFNLFGELWNDPDRLARAGGALWQLQLPGDRVEFEWSPGRRDPAYTGDLTALDVALFFGQPEAGQTVIGIETKYHEHAKAEATPPSEQIERYRAITEQAIKDRNVFRPDWEARIVGKPLQQVWRDHLLLLSMLQQDSKRWRDGRYILVYPSGNTSYRQLARSYTEVLDNKTTFAYMTVEELLDAHVLHDPETETRFRERYLW